MRTGLSLLQTQLLDANKKSEIFWGFWVYLGGDGPIDYFWSTSTNTFESHNYEFKIRDFSPISMAGGQEMFGISAPANINIKVINKNNEFTPSDFVGALIKIKLVMKADLALKSNSDEISWEDGDLETSHECISEIMSWSFRVKTASSTYQTLTLQCVDWLQQYLEGDYPNGGLINDIFPVAKMHNDNICVPKIWGEPFFPIRWARDSEEGFYVLGHGDIDLYEIRSPKEFGSRSDFLESDPENTFTLKTKTGTDGTTYDVAQFIVVDADGDGTNDSNAMFGPIEGPYYDVPCRFSKSATEFKTNPIEIIKEILIDFGIPSTLIDSDAYTAAYNIWQDRNLRFNVGLFYKISRKKLLPKLLTMVNTRLIVRDKLYFKVNSTTSQHTINNSWVVKNSDVGAGNFKISSTMTSIADGGYVSYAYKSGSDEDPIDQLIKTVVPTGSTSTSPSDITIEAEYINDSTHAQKIGIMAVQKMITKELGISAKLKSKCLQLEVGDIVSIEGGAYGAIAADYDVLITNMTINRKLEVNVNMAKYKDDLSDWGDLNIGAPTIQTDDSRSIFSPVISGPSSPGTTNQPNQLYNILRIGEDDAHISLNGTDTYISIGDPPPDSYGDNEGIWLGIDSEISKLSIYKDSDNYLQFDGDNINIGGNITAESGSIGGWTIGATTLYNGTDIILDSSNKKISVNSDTFGNEGIQIDYNAGDPRFYVGDGSDAYINFDGTKLTWKGSNSELDASGNITCTGGEIGGWTIDSTSLYSDNIIIDSNEDKITVNTITIDGVNNRIRSDNYVSGVQGSGFTLEPDLLEVGNIACRGILRTAVFQKDTISAVGGNIIVSKGADILNIDMSALDVSTLTINGDETFSVGDILRIKDGLDDEWFEITNDGSAPTYTVTRDKNNDYDANDNPAWAKGVTVVNYGANGDGGIYMTASETNAPYSNVFTHAGEPWSVLTTRLRIGNLNGFLGYDTDLYGIAIGETTKYLKYDPTNGLVIKGNITAESGEIGGWTIGATSLYNGTDIILDSSNKKISVNSATVGNEGIQIDYNAGDPRFYVGDGANAFIYFDGTRLRWKGSNSELDTSGNLVCTGGTIGGWTLGATTLYNGTDIILDSSNKKISVNSDTFGYEGIQIDYNAGAARFYVGDGAYAFLKFDGTKLTWKGSNSELDTSGNLVCTGGTIGGWTLGATTLYNGTDIILDSSNKKISVNSDTFGYEGIQIDYNAGAARFYVGDGAYAFLKFDGTKLTWKGSNSELDTSGNIKISSGGDIELAGSDTDPGKLKFTGTSYQTVIGSYATSGADFSIVPQTDDSVFVQFGNDTSNRFYNFKAWTSNKIELGVKFDDNDLISLTMYKDSTEDQSELKILMNFPDDHSSHISVRGVVYEGTFYGSIVPEYHAGAGSGITNWDLGLTGFAWDDCWADNWFNVADFYFLDERKDLETICNIKSSDKIEERSGLPIIDDDTLPDWMLVRDKRTKKISRDPEGRPWVSNRMLFSLLLGAFKEVSKRLENLEEKLNE